jgi:hypothetical protein
MNSSNYHHPLPDCEQKIAIKEPSNAGVLGLKSKIALSLN